MKVVYVVEIGWRVMFEFDNIEEASTFADQAKKHRVDDNNDEVKITLVDRNSKEVSDD